MAYVDVENLRIVLLDDEALSARKLSRRRAGLLQLTSGTIVACDPLVQPERAAFSRRVSARGPCLVEVLQGPYGKHALAVLWLRERTAYAAQQLSWEPALLAGQSMATLKEDEFFGYTVDAGAACFMDADAADAIAQRAKQHAGDADFNYYESVLCDEMGDSHITDHYPLGHGTPNNVIIFDAGYGDGVYPSYWAVATDGEPIALVTDFMTIKGGDARSDRERAAEAYRAGLAPEKLGALEALSAAVSRGDVDAVRTLLSEGHAGPNEIVPSSGETAIASAIRLDQTECLRTLLGRERCPDMPEKLQIGSARSYLEYARFLKKPRSPALISLLEQAQGPAEAPRKKGWWPF